MWTKPNYKPIAVEEPKCKDAPNCKDCQAQGEPQVGGVVPHQAQMLQVPTQGSGW